MLKKAEFKKLTKVSPTVLEILTSGTLKGNHAGISKTDDDIAFFFFFFFVLSITNMIFGA